MSDFFDRLDKFMEYKGINDNQITVKTGISNGLLGKGRKSGLLSLKSIEKILYAYPKLDGNWWITGKGSMIKSHDRLINAINNLEKELSKLKSSLEG